MGNSKPNLGIKGESWYMDTLGQKVLTTVQDYQCPLPAEPCIGSEDLGVDG